MIGLFDHGCVRLNREPCDLPSLTVAAGDEVQLIYDPAQRYHPRKKPRRQLGFDIVFEDRHLIVVAKPAGLLTVPTERGESNTLVEKVSEYLRHVARCPQAFIVHRPDRAVSGLLVFGKTASIAHAIREQFASHKPEREYVALVSGHLREDRGTFNSVLATDRNLNRYSTRDSAAGQRAITHFQVLRPSFIRSLRLR